MAKVDVKSGVRRRGSAAAEIIGTHEPTREPARNPGSRKVPVSKSQPQPKRVTREDRGVKKATYTLPVTIIDAVTQKHAELFSQRPGKPVIDKSQIAAAAIELGLQNEKRLRSMLLGND